MDCYNRLLIALLHNCAFSIDSYSPINKFYSFVIFSVLINAVIIELSCFNTLSLHIFSFVFLSHYLEFYITDNALKVSTSLYCFTTSISHGVEIIPWLWGTGISDAIFRMLLFQEFSLKNRKKYLTTTGYRHERNMIGLAHIKMSSLKTMVKTSFKLVEKEGFSVHFKWCSVVYANDIYTGGHNCVRVIIMSDF